MYNVGDIQSGFSGLVGWRQNYNSGGTQLTALTSSSSGLFFNDEHPDLTFDNLVSLAPDFVRTEVNQSAINSAFTNWLLNKTNAYMIRGIEDWVSMLKADRSGKNLLERKELFTVSNNRTTLDTDDGKIVGFEIRPSNSRSVLYRIWKLGLQLTAAQSIDLMLFNSRKSAPVVTASLNYTDTSDLQWFDMPDTWKMTGEGNWFIGYDQNELIGQSINGVYDYGFSTGGVLAYPTGSYFIASGFKAPVGGSSIWNLSQTAYTSDTNYGLNLSMTAYCDYTSFLLEQKHLFASLISKRVAMGLLMELKNPNARTNRHEGNIDTDQINFDIHGDTGGRDTFTLVGQYKKALKNLELDETSIDPVCMCRKSNGVRWTTK